MTSTLDPSNHQEYDRGDDPPAREELAPWAYGDEFGHLGVAHRRVRSLLKQRWPKQDAVDWPQVLLSPRQTTLDSYLKTAIVAVSKIVSEEQNQQRQQAYRKGIEAAVVSTPKCKIRERYHQLVDQSLIRRLSAPEDFELGCIEGRLDSEDGDFDLEERDRQWDLEREALVDSIEDLLGKLKG